MNRIAPRRRRLLNRVRAALPLNRSRRRFCETDGPVLPGAGRAIARWVVADDGRLALAWELER